LPTQLLYPFYSSQQRRLRAGWRILLQRAMLLFVAAVLQGLASFWGWLSGDFSFLVGQIILAIATTVSVYFARRFLDRRSFISLGLTWHRRGLLDLIFGFVLAGLLMGGIYLLEWLVGWLEFEGFIWQEVSWGEAIAQTFLALLGFGITVGWYEELQDRGYWLQNLRDGLNLPVGIFLSSAVFAFLHLGNPNASWISTLGIFLAGIFLAYGWVCTGLLWLPIGLHVGWNFFEGVVFGFPVSGIDTFSLIQQRAIANEITGGEFGPEAGLIMIPTITLGMMLVYAWSRNR